MVRSEFLPLGKPMGYKEEIFKWYQKIVPIIRPLFDRVGTHFISCNQVIAKKKALKTISKLT